MFFEYPALLWLLAIPVLLCVLYIYRQVAGEGSSFQGEQQISVGERRVSRVECRHAHPVRVVHGGIGPYNNMYG